MQLDAFDRKVIYVYRHLDVESHKGWLKVGETKKSRITGSGVNPRIQEQNTAANVAYEVLYTTDAVRNNGTPFSDKDIHDLLVAKDIEREDTINPETHRQSEWFKTDLDTIIDTIESYKMDAVQDSRGKITDFTLRNEQKQAITQTKAYYAESQEDANIQPTYLWNAKPRFGKTLTAYCFASEIRASKVLIVTNRPAIADSWYTDFCKFDFDDQNQSDGKFRWVFTSSSSVKDRLGRPGNIYTREDQISNPALRIRNMVHFISLQDVKGLSRGSENVQEFKSRNRWIFDLNWDLVIIDESHEGTETIRALRVFENINTGFTLHLSGTPFKALASNKFSSKQIYNWSYTDEQTAKNSWPITDGPNPYAGLPKMSIYTYQLSRILEVTAAEAKSEDSEFAFDLGEFFRVATVDGAEKFVHEDKVRLFISKLSNPQYQYPFSTPEYRANLRHTFWLLPRVKACQQMKKLLLEDEYFSANYAPEDIIIAAGDGDDDRKAGTALEEVRRRIGVPGGARHPLETRTITLSCGQLATGVTIPAWTAVLMLNNCKSPSLYMQAAFRAQNPFEITTSAHECITKENCFVFDFAPDRILQTLAELAESISHGSTTYTHEEKIKILINFLPVIAEDAEGRMKYLDANEVLTIPLKLITEEVVSRGFMSNRLFENISNVFGCPQSVKDILSKLDEAKIGRNVEKDKDKKTKLNPTVRIWTDDDNKIHINEDIVIATTNGLFGDKQYVQIGSDESKEVAATIEDAVLQAHKNGYSAESIKAVKQAITKKLPQVTSGTPEIPRQKELPDEKPPAKEKTDEEKVRDRLRGFARTIPSFLMAYGTKDTTLANFGDTIPDDVFLELTNITKSEFKQLRDGFDYEAEDENGNRYPAHFDGLFNEGVFNSSIQAFEQKQKELAHYYTGDTADDIFEYIPPQANNQIFTPKRVVRLMVDLLEQENPDIFKNTTYTFIDLYMKSGMYLAEIARRIFHHTRAQYPSDEACIKHILENQVYGFAPSAILDASTKNYLFGFDENMAIDQKNFVQYDTIKATKTGTLKQLVSSIFNPEGGDMKFTAVIGNPPYNYDAGRRKIPLYQDFIKSGSNPNFADYACFVTPDGFIKGGQQLEPLREYLISSKTLKYIEFHKEPIFPEVAVDAAITLFDNNGSFDQPKKRIFTADGRTKDGTLSWEYRDVIIDEDKYKILRKFENIVSSLPGGKFMGSAVTGWAPFGLNTKCYKSNREKFLDEKDEQHNIRVLVGEEKDFYWIDPHDKFAYEGSDGRMDDVKTENIEKWKMVFPKAGTVNEKPLQTRILRPGEIFTDKYLCVFADSEAEAKNIEKYFNSKFYRAGLDSKATSWNLYRKWHDNIPVQDFSKSSDIDWTADSHSLDQQLFEKYHFTKDDIETINKRIK